LPRIRSRRRCLHNTGGAPSRLLSADEHGGFHYGRRICVLDSPTWPAKEFGTEPPRFPTPSFLLQQETEQEAPPVPEQDHRPGAGGDAEDVHRYVNTFLKSVLCLPAHGPGNLRFPLSRKTVYGPSHGSGRNRPSRPARRLPRARARGTTPSSTISSSGTTAFGPVSSGRSRSSGASGSWRRLGSTSFCFRPGTTQRTFPSLGRSCCRRSGKQSR